MTDNIAMPFALSLSKGLSKGGWHAPQIRSWFDKLTTNGKDVVSHAPQIRSWFDKPVLSTVEGPVLGTVEGLTTNGKAVVSHIYSSQEGVLNGLSAKTTENRPYHFAKQKSPQRRFHPSGFRSSW